MGKAEDVERLQSTVLDAQGTTSGEGGSDGCCLGCSRVRKLVTLRCVLALVLGVAVLLSALFWLPIFRFGDRRDLDLDYAGHDIVASFMLKKSGSFLSDHMWQLENDIFSEFPYFSTKVEIILLEPAGPNTTKVVFAVESDVTTQSLIREIFVNLIITQYVLRLTAPLFGEPFSFDVIKFKGGITVSPHQKAFLMQNEKIPFNFTLNFSVGRLLNNFNELTDQLKMGLHLTPYENLYLGLTNLKGSTIAPPTTVQSQVVLAVGMDPSRVKQLAQTITGSHTKNLGLNNTVFGRVKHVRLSSILSHSLGNDGSSPSSSPVPSPSPMMRPHHHHHHHHDHVATLSPTVSPSPSAANGGSSSGKATPVSAPAPAKVTEPPCHFGHNNRYPWKHKHSRIAPTASPVSAPYIAPSRPRKIRKPAPKISPVTAERPSPNVAYSHSQAPSPSEYHARPPDVMSIISPSPFPFSAASARSISSKIWAVLLFILLGMAL